MSKFELLEFQFDPDDFTLTLEDEFQLARLSNEIEKVDDIETLRVATLKLLQLTTHRQAIIRSLCRRLGNLEAEDEEQRHPS